MGGLVPISSSHWNRGGVHNEQVASPLQGQNTVHAKQPNYALAETGFPTDLSFSAWTAVS